MRNGWISRMIMPGLALASLANCSKQDTDATYGAGREPIRPDATVTPRATSAVPATAKTIPAKFHGTWDFVKGSCDPASDLRMVIGGDSIDFYESHGAVTAVRGDGANAVVVDLAMEGEGEKWTMSERYSLSDDGQTLTPTAIGKPAGEPMPLKRCPAAAAT